MAAENGVQSNGGLVDETEERAVQQDYWKQHSSEATVEAMMLDSKAADIDKLERPEVMALLGSVEGKRVVELGAGIGRFTGPLAKVAKSVFALDFMQNLIDQNEATNGHLGNIEFRCGDATELRLDPGCCDVVFTNWLLMYLSDKEVAALAERMLSWVGEDGVVFFRESCFRQSGDKARANNPTHYRNPRQYFEVFDNARQVLPDGRVAHFELVLCKSVDTYVRVKQNQNQVCWKWRKVVSEKAAAPDYRHFLDGHQYNAEGVARYERVFGQGFVSPGGLDSAVKFTKLLNLQPDEQVLDVGCGVGGSALHMARTYGCYVYGIDLSVNMILTALERLAASGNGDKVSFEISDCTKRDFPPESFDVVHSRDTCLHIHDKPALFARLLSLLKPGGRLLITDYCCSHEEELSPRDEFAAHIARRRYDLHSVERYGDMLREAGFTDVAAMDKTGEFKASLQAELAKLEADRQGFVAEFGQEEYDSTVESWRAKLAWVEAGQHRWGLFRARKPLAGRDYHERIADHF